MARQKAAVIAINYLCNLNKVGLSKSLILVNNLNTWAAAERLDLHVTDGHHFFDDPPVNSEQGSVRALGINQHPSQNVQNGHYKDSSQQNISSGVYEVAEDPQRIDRQGRDSGENNGGVGNGNGSSGELTHGAGSSWSSGIPPQNFNGSFQYSGPGDRRNVALASTHTSNSSPPWDSNYNAQNTHVGTRMPQHSGGNNYGEVGNGIGSSGQLTYGAGSSWPSGMPSQNSYGSFQYSGAEDRQNVALASTLTPNTSLPQANNYNAQSTYVGTTMPQHFYGNYQQSVNYGYQPSSGNNGNYQQSVNYGYQQSSGNNGNYQQSVNYGYQQSSGNNYGPSNDQNAMMLSQGAGNFVSEGESSDARPPQGTLQELDAYFKEEKIKEALGVLGLLEQRGITVDLPRYLDLMKMCKDKDALEEAKSIHKHLVKSLSPLRVSSYNEILQMYARCESMVDALEVLGQLEQQGTTVDLAQYLDLMKLCKDEDNLEEAKSIHKHLVSSLSPLRVCSYNKILQMYARCGSMVDAHSVFSKMPERNRTTWDTILSGYAQNGLGEEAIDIFTCFKEAGLKPDGQIYIAVFDACAVTGDVIEGMLHFQTMSKVNGIVPTMKHYARIVNMLGTSGHLNEALEFIERMPFEPSLDVWETLMNLSRIQGNLELGDRCAEIVEQLDPSRLVKEMKSGLVPATVSDLSKEKQKKKSSKTALESKSKHHEYRAGDKSHPENDKIYALLKGMKEQLKEAGYVPDCRFVLHDIDQEGKEEALMAHSERLALAYGFITSAPRMPLRVIKNLRVCVDCHNALKIVSDLVGRELIMRDAKRFHHMKDGKCSCNDYW